VGWTGELTGSSVSYEFVAHQLLRLFEHYNIGFDKWNFRQLKPWLLQAGLGERQLTEHWIEFGQGSNRMRWGNYSEPRSSSSASAQQKSFSGRVDGWWR
jgi:hypothetical protein